MAAAAADATANPQMRPAATAALRRWGVELAAERLMVLVPGGTVAILLLAVEEVAGEVLLGALGAAEPLAVKERRRSAVTAGPVQREATTPRLVFFRLAAGVVQTREIPVLVVPGMYGSQRFKEF
jgi:hypothetical protein